MASQIPLPEDLQRFGAAKEATFKGSPGSIKQPDGLLSVEAVPSRVDADRLVQRNSFKDDYSPKPGNQAFELSSEVLVSDQTGPDCGDWIANSMGIEVPASAITESGISTNVSFSVGGGETADNILRAAVAGLNEHRPATQSGTTVTWAIKPSGTPTTIKNASETTTPTGRAFRDKPDGTVDSYQLLVDQAGYAGENWFKAQGAVPSPFKIVWTLDGLLKLSFPWRAAVWTAFDSTASGLADTVDTAETYLSDVVSFGLQSLSVPAVLAPIGLKALDITMGYEWIPDMAGTGMSGTAIPGSNIVRWVRGNRNGNRISLTVDDGNFEDWDALRLSETPFQFFVEFQPGNPSQTVAAAAGSRLCVWAPRVKIVAVSRAKVAGLVCTAMELFVERSLIPVPLLPSYLSIFGAAG